MLNCPVLFLIFNRPDTTKQVFEAIRKARPRQLFVAADGARTDVHGEIGRCDATREIIAGVDWDCEVKTLFREENLGCKMAVSSAITWFFEHVEHGIILEDDCLPSDSFFTFCADLLERYKDEERIMMISGDNFQDGIRRGTASYFFTQIPHIWGWATWRRAWKSYDVSMRTLPAFIKEGLANCISPNIDIRNYWLSAFIATYEGRIDTWDYQWVYAILSCGRLSICPQVNMVKNIGFGTDSTHTRDSTSRYACMKRFDIREMIHPWFLSEEIPISHEADRYEFQVELGENLSLPRINVFRWRKLLRKRKKTAHLVDTFLRSQSPCGSFENTVGSQRYDM